VTSMMMRVALADARETKWIARRFHTVCATFGTDVTGRNGRLLIGRDPKSG
jgi:hypothetical protein